MSDYSIRLRGPWRVDQAPESVPGQETATTTITPPCPFPTVRTDSGAFVRLRRRFHPPSGHTSETRYSLFVPCLPCGTSVSLNGRLLAETGSRSGPLTVELGSDLPLNLEVMFQYDDSEMRNTHAAIPDFDGATLQIHSPDSRTSSE